MDLCCTGVEGIWEMEDRRNTVNCFPLVTTLPWQSWIHSSCVFWNWASTGLTLLSVSHESAKNPLGPYTVLLNYRILMKYGGWRVWIFRYVFIQDMNWERIMYGGGNSNEELFAVRGNANHTNYQHLWNCQTTIIINGIIT